MLQENPLVSIIVITYNSSKYVLETLESAKAQDYQNIELIISDDCSSDNTIAVCKEWIQKNKERFIRTKTITVESNTGITPNCNRGLYNAQGEWIKLIAGDDALESNCISVYLDQIHHNKGIMAFHSKHIAYQDEFLEINKLPTSFSEKTKISKMVSNINDQKRIIPLQNYISAPTAILSRNVLLKIGGFDEEIVAVEDWPLWLRLSQENYYVQFVDFFSCKYRVHSSSISFDRNGNQLISKFYIQNDKIYRRFIYPKMSFPTKIMYNLAFWGRQFMFRNGLIKRNFLNSFIYYVTNSAFALKNKVALWCHLKIMKYSK